MKNEWHWLIAAILMTVSFLFISGCGFVNGLPTGAGFSSSSSSAGLHLTNDMTIQDFENYPAALVNNNQWGPSSVLTVDSTLCFQGSNSVKHSTTNGTWVGWGFTNFTSLNLRVTNLKPAGSLADRLVMWIRATPDGGVNNSFEFQIADQSNFPIGSEWTKWSDQLVKPVVLTNNTWVQVEILFSEMTNASGTAVDIAHIARIQFSHYWSGTYNYDLVYSGHYTN